MNSFVVVAFFENPPELFHTSDWPLHVTVIRPFSTDQSDEKIVSVIREVVANHGPIVSAGMSRELFGGTRKIPVTEIEHTPELVALHEELLEALQPSVAFRPPEYGFRPHVTDQKTGSVAVGEKVNVDSLSLVWMENEKRQVLHTVWLK